MTIPVLAREHVAPPHSQQSAWENSWEQFFAVQKM